MPDEEFTPKVGPTEGEPTQRMPRNVQDAPRPKTSGKESRRGQDKKLQVALQGLYETSGVLLTGFGFQREDDGVIGMGLQVTQLAEQTSLAWMDLADQNPKIKAVLLRVTETSALATVVTLHIGMALPLLVSRQIIPANIAQGMASAATAGQPGSNGQTPTE